MRFEFSCSGCGERHKPQINNYAYRQFSRISQNMVKRGWRAYGGVIYCPECSRTWQERNGQDRPLQNGQESTDWILDDMCNQLYRECLYYKQALRNAEKSQW